MATLYPEGMPYDEGMLPVGDGNAIHWQVCGNPDGIAAVVLHGGPGSGLSASARRFFDPAAYRIVQFDQRGCGRSIPHASDPDCDLRANTTRHLIADMEALRVRLGLERWLVWGHSWGSTLALAYAQQHPQRVLALVLVGVTMTRRSEIDWLYRDVAPLFPAQWEAFRNGAPADRRDGDLVAAYYDLLGDADPAVREKAALDWHSWEAVSVSSSTGDELPEKWRDPAFRMARARIVTHYFHHGAWLDDGILLRNAHRLAGIRGAMIHGRLDLQAPLTTAWELSRAWPDGRLVVVGDAGHSYGEAAMGAAIVETMDGFVRRLAG